MPAYGVRACSNVPHVLILSAAAALYSIWVVPGLFGRNGTLDNATATGRIDSVLVEKLHAYWSWAQEESKITGFIPWHWTDLEPGFQPSSDTLGGNEYPQTLRWIAERVRALRSTSEERGHP